MQTTMHGAWFAIADPYTGAVNDSLAALRALCPASTCRARERAEGHPEDSALRGRHWLRSILSIQDVLIVGSWLAIALGIKILGLPQLNKLFDYG